MAFQDEYTRLERDFREQIASDWKLAVERLRESLYLPNHRPDAPADFVLIGAEPSLEIWAPDPDTGREKLAKGLKNFAWSWGDFILHHCIREYLCADGETYYLTDLSKGAMPTALAEYDRMKRYDRWFPLLEKELEIVAKPNPLVIAIGKSTGDFLRSKGLKGYSDDIVVHFSQQASSIWKKVAESNQELFDGFVPTVSPRVIKRTVEQVLKEADMDSFLDETLKRLTVGAGLTESRKQLMFTYKVQFGDIRSKHGLP